MATCSRRFETENAELAAAELVLVATKKTAQAAEEAAAVTEEVAPAAQEAADKLEKGRKDLLKRKRSLMLLISAEDAGHAEQAAEEAAALAVTEGVASNTQEAAPATEEAAEAAALFGNCSATALKEQLSGTSTLKERVALFDKWLEPARKKRLPVD